MPTGTYADTTQDGVEVSTPAFVTGIYFGEDTCPTTEVGLDTRAAAFANDHVGVFIGTTTGHAFMVRQSDCSELDLGATTGHLGVAISPNAAKTLLYVALMGTTTWRLLTFNTSFVQIADVSTALPAGVAYAAGMLDLSTSGVPVFGSQRPNPFTVNGVVLYNAVERNGVWLGAGPTGGLFVVYPDGTVTEITPDDAFEPHLTLSNDGTTLYISYRGGTGMAGFSTTPNGGMLQALYVPKAHPIANAQGHLSTKPWFDFFDRIAAYIGSPVNLANTSGILPPSSGGSGSGGGGVPIGAAPVDAEYLVGALNGTLTAERLVTDTATATWDLTTPGQAKVNVVSTSLGSWIPLVDGSEPPNFITDGAGVLILTFYTP